MVVNDDDDVLESSQSLVASVRENTETVSVLNGGSFANRASEQEPNSETEMVFNERGFAGRDYPDPDSEVDVEKLRQCRNHSVYARWMVRAIDVALVHEALTEWFDEGSFTSGVPEVGERLFESNSSDCDCQLCFSKRRGMEAVAVFHRALMEFQQAAEADPPQHEGLKKAMAGDGQKPQGNDTEATGDVGEDLEQKLVDEVKKEWAHVLVKSKEHVQQSIMQLALSQKRKEIEANLQNQRLVKRNKEEAVRRAAKDIKDCADKVRIAANEVVSAIIFVLKDLDKYVIYWNNAAQSCNENLIKLDLTRLKEIEQLPHLPTQLFDDDPLVLDTDDALDELKAFHTSLSNAFKQAPLLSKDDALFAGKMEDSQALLEGWHGGEFEILFVPEAGALETEGCHPLLSSIMYRVASMAKSADNFPGQPVSNHKYALSAGSSIQKDVQQVEECFRAVLPYACRVHVEIKPVKREGTDLSTLHDEGSHQVVVDLAERIFHCFHLGGIGSDHKCVGVVLTLVSIDILEMELVNVGTKRVNVRLRRTMPHFLFDLETTTHLLGSSQNVPTFRFHADRPHHGLAMLAAAMRSSAVERSPLPVGELSYQDGPDSEERQFYELLGIGGFCYVYKLDEKLFIKIPRSPQCLSSLESEMAVLRLLHHECIPGCPNAKLGLVSYRRKCEVSEFSGLLLSGIVGVSASTYNAIFNRDQLTQIMTNVKSALVYAHESKYCHLDVCPSNIIVGVDVGTSSMRVQLGDWGSAKSVNAKMKGFWGSVGFAHDAIHKEGEHGKWEPKPEYDFGSLAYTMAALMGGFHHEVPWPHFFDNIEVNERMLKSRRDMSLDIIQKSSLDSELRAVLCGYVPEPPPLVATGASLPEAKASTQYPSTGPTKKRKLPEAQLSTPSMHAAATTQKLAPVDTTALSPSTRRS